MLNELFGRYADLVLPAVPSRFGPREVRVMMMISQPDGQMTWGGLNFLFVGTAPLPAVEDARRAGRRIVRKGLQDVLEWLGEGHWNDEPSGSEILQALRTGADPMRINNKHISAM